MNKKLYILRSGYKYIHTPEHPNSGKQGYVAEHRLVMESHIGRLLTRKEVVHHIDENRQNNSIENLELIVSAGVHVYTYHRSPKFTSKGRKPVNGYQKGMIPWNKGTKRVCAKCGGKKAFYAKQCIECSKGLRYSIKTEFKKGKAPWNKGKAFSRETREKMRISALNRKRS